MDPVQFGMLMMLNLGTGLCTPPVGTCLFVGCSIGKISNEETVKTIWPFYLAMFCRADVRHLRPGDLDGRAELADEMTVRP